MGGIVGKSTGTTLSSNTVSNSSFTVQGYTGFAESSIGFGVVLPAVQPSLGMIAGQINTGANLASCTFTACSTDLNALVPPPHGQTGFNGHDGGYIYGYGND
jgi:hypothetical protein